MRQSVSLLCSPVYLSSSCPLYLRQGRLRQLEGIDSCCFALPQRTGYRPLVLSPELPPLHHDLLKSFLRAIAADPVTVIERPQEGIGRKEVVGLRIGVNATYFGQRGQTILCNPQIQRRWPPLCILCLIVGRNDTVVILLLADCKRKQKKEGRCWEAHRPSAG